MISKRRFRFVDRRCVGKSATLIILFFLDWSVASDFDPLKQTVDQGLELAQRFKVELLNDLTHIFLLLCARILKFRAKSEHFMRPICLNQFLFIDALRLINDCANDVFNHVIEDFDQFVVGG